MNELLEQLRDSVAELSNGTVTITPGEVVNTSGFIPYDTCIVILPDEVSDRFAGTSLIRPDQVRDKEKYAQTIATLIAAGDNAFMDWGDAAKPKAGDRIVVGRYVGNTHDGIDGKKYTVCRDEDVLAGWSGK